RLRRFAVFGLRLAIRRSRLGRGQLRLLAKGRIRDVNPRLGSRTVAGSGTVAVLLSRGLDRLGRLLAAAPTPRAAPGLFLRLRLFGSFLRRRLGLFGGSRLLFQGLRRLDLELRGL